MKTQNTQSSIPLALALAELPDIVGYEDAVQIAELISDSYDPVTQTSTIPIHAGKGTSRTVCYKGTGTVIWPDSKYPTDDA